MSATAEPVDSSLRAVWTRTRALLPQRADLVAARRNPRRDLIAGVTVAVVALPLALAFGISSGLGAGAGIATAIVAGVLAAIFGGSNLQVSGPTGAMTVVLVPIVAKHGASSVLVVGLLAGLILIALAYLKAGRYMRYIPLPVIEGFTIGIAIIIGLQQVPAALGVHPSASKVAIAAAQSVRLWFASPQWQPLLIAVGVIALMLLGARWRPSLPMSLVAVVIATLVVQVGHLDVAVIGSIPRGLPSPQLPPISWGEIESLLIPAVAVAALAALESLLSATVADGMSVGERHNPDRELFGQGIANLVTPLFGGIPATAAIARTAVNVRTGARSRVAAITHSVVLLLIILIAAPWVGRIPLAALAGVLIATALQMIEVSSVLILLRATRSDALVLAVTAIATVAFDLVTAVIVGIVVAGGLALRQLARSASVDEIPLDHSDHSAEESDLLKEHIVAYRLDGALFFGAAHTFLLELSEVSDVRVVILRLSRVQTIDATGASILGDTIKRLEDRGITVLLSGIRPAHTRILRTLGVYGELAHENHLFDTTPEAIEHARAHVHRVEHSTESAPGRTPDLDSAAG